MNFLANPIYIYIYIYMYVYIYIYIYMYVCIHHIFFIHSSVIRHLGCFCVLAIVNTAAMNTAVHVSSWIIVFSGYMLRSGIVGSYANYIFSFENINVWVICIQEVFLEFRFLFIVLLLLTFPIWRSFSLIEKMVKFESLMFSPPPPPPPPLPLCSSPLPPPSSSSAHITPSGPSLRIVLILLFVPIHMLFFLICFLKGIFFFFTVPGFFILSII